MIQARRRSPSLERDLLYIEGQRICKLEVFVVVGRVISTIKGQPFPPKMSFLLSKTSRQERLSVALFSFPTCLAIK
jgi:hypothetical protein